MKKIILSKYGNSYIDANECLFHKGMQEHIKDTLSVIDTNKNKYFVYSHDKDNNSFTLVACQSSLDSAMRYMNDSRILMDTTKYNLSI